MIPSSRSSAPVGADGPVLLVVSSTGSLVRGSATLSVGPSRADHPGADPRHPRRPPASGAAASHGCDEPAPDPAAARPRPASGAAASHGCDGSAPDPPAPVPAGGRRDPLVRSTSIRGRARSCFVAGLPPRGEPRPGRPRGGDRRARAPLRRRLRHRGLAGPGGRARGPAATAGGQPLCRAGARLPARRRRRRRLPRPRARCRSPLPARRHRPLGRLRDERGRARGAGPRRARPLDAAPRVPG